MHDLGRHPYFEPWTDATSGVTSYVLRERVAPLQQSFYFTNSSVSADENWLWFYAAFPPNLQQMLGVVCLDPARPSIRYFPQAGFAATSPMVAPEGDAAYFCMGRHVFKIQLDGQVQTICSVPEEYIAYRQFKRIVSHLTMSADGKYFLLDGDLGNFWWIGTGNIATGEVKVLLELATHYDHAQFSPVNPELFLLAQDWWKDKITGKHFRMNHRIWLSDVAQTLFEPLQPSHWYDHGSRGSHEWWSKDGMVCWNDYSIGAFECHPRTRQMTHVWKRPLCHAHCSSDRQLWCADESPYKWGIAPVDILFFDRRTGRERKIVSDMPAPPVERSLYHLDPHPQFSPRDSWIVYTTMVRGRVDVALTPVQPLLA